MLFRTLQNIVICCFCSLAAVSSAHAARIINSVTLNGGATVTVNPGANITAAISVTTSGGTNDWNSTGWRISTTAPGTVTCVNHTDYTNSGTFSETFTITAPATPGTYNAYFIAYDNNTCSSNASPTQTMTGAIIVNAPPTVSSIALASTNPAAAGSSVSWTVTFSEAVTGVDATDFALAANFVTGAAITSVSGSGATWTVTANTGAGTGSLGLNLVNNSSIIDANSSPLTAGFTGALYAVGTMAEYRMEQTSWTGASGEALDSAGSYAGTAGSLTATLPVTGNTGPTPAITGDPGTCRWGGFTRANKQYLGLSSSFPNLGASGDAFTITAWIRTTDNTQPGQRIFIDDESNSTGYGFSLGDGGTGLLRFYTRGVNPISTDTANVIANNTWYFVAAVADVPNKTKYVYVYNAAGTQLAAVNDTWTEASFGSDTGIASIGGETNAAGEGNNAFGFSGNIDEVKVFRAALDATALNVVRQQTHSCIQFHHLEISDSSSGTGLTCTPSTLTVRACATADCSTLYTGGVSGTLTASSGAVVNWGGGNGNFVIAAGNSSTTKTIQVTTPATPITIGIAATPSPAPASTTTCTFTSCQYTAADAGLLLTASNHLSCAPQTITLQAVRRSSTSTTCVPAFANINKNLTLYLSYLNPATGTRTASLNYVTSAGGATSSIPSLSTTAGSPSTLTNLYWNATGTATINNFIYPDAGQIQLNPVLIDSVTGLTMTAISGHQPIVAPASFLISGIPATLTAGSPFNATITAQNSCAPVAATPNFNSTVVLTSSNPVPGIGNAAHFTNNLTGFVNGVASTTLTWNEVGSIDLNASLNTYLGWTPVTPPIVTSVSTLTPFWPAYFDTFITTQGCGTFTYGGTPLLAGQPFTVRVKAKRAGANLTDATNTANFAGATWAKAVVLADANAGGGTLYNNSLATTDFVAGIASRSDVAYRFADKLTAPYDLDVRALASNPTISSATHVEGRTNMRSGRLRLFNAFGPANKNLLMSAQTQYWNGNTWILSSDDSCTALATANFYLSSGLTTASVLNISSGVGNITLTAPVSNATLSVDIAANLDPTSVDNSCLSTHGGTASVKPWLRSLNGNCVATYDRDPTARATFGIYSPENQKTIHVRELF